MTHTNTPAHHHRPGHGPAPEHSADLIELLDLDGSLGASVLDVALDAASAALDRVPRVILDLGAGTGTGSLALAQRFPKARIHSLDASPEMLDHLGAAVAAAGLADRVQQHLVDLDDEWPAVVPRDVDLAWAALSLHHLSDPERMLRQIFEVMRPGGVLVVTEFTRSGTYDLGRAGLGERLVEALAERGYPVTAEWTDALTVAGFAPVVRTEAEFEASARSSEGARYLGLQLVRCREQLRGDLSAEESAGLDAAIAAAATGSPEIGFSSGRVIWVGIRPRGIESTARGGADL